MLFQYLVNTLEADFVPRRIAYKGKLVINLAGYLVLASICQHSKKMPYQFLFVLQSHWTG
jgi:hypothetical protein